MQYISLKEHPEPTLQENIMQECWTVLRGCLGVAESTVEHLRLGAEGGGCRIQELQT